MRPAWGEKGGNQERELPEAERKVLRERPRGSSGPCWREGDMAGTGMAAGLAMLVSGRAGSPEPGGAGGNQRRVEGRRADSSFFPLSFAVLL